MPCAAPCTDNSAIHNLLHWQYLQELLDMNISLTEDLQLQSAVLTSTKCFTTVHLVQ